MPARLPSGRPWFASPPATCGYFSFATLLLTSGFFSPTLVNSLPSGCEVVNRVPLSFSILCFKHSCSSSEWVWKHWFSCEFHCTAIIKTFPLWYHQPLRQTIINVLIICYLLARIVFKKYLWKEPMKASPWMLLTLGIFSCGHWLALLRLQIVLPLLWCFSTLCRFLTGLSELFM